EIVPHTIHIRSDFHELDHIHQISPPFGRQLHLNEHLNTNDGQPFIHERMVKDIFQLRTERRGRQVIYTDTIHFYWDAGFEGHHRTVMLKSLFSYQEIYIDRCSNVSVSAHRQSPCQGVANAKIV